MKKNFLKKLQKCRVCKSINLQKVFELGPTPLANAFLTKKQSEEEELFYPLDVLFCNDCSFLQLGHVVFPEILFSDYVYFSSTSQVFINHFNNFANDISERFSLNNKSLIIDIGSNDGILLKPFNKKGIKVLGIEPAKNIAKIAKKSGINTISEFFTSVLGKKIVNKYGKASVVTATNVFAHIDDLDEIVKGLKIILDKDGVFIVEAPYIVDFIEKNYFDLVYHEHLSYWSVKSLKDLFNRLDMRIFDVQKVDVHGGSLRVFICKQNATHKENTHVKQFLQLEKKLKIAEKETYINYSNNIQNNRIELLKLLTTLKKKGKTIAGYGAPAKGNTLLNYFNIGTDTLDFIIDDSKYKQGLYTPGKRIPVVSSAWLKEKKPDYLLILAWNFAPSIISMTQEYQKKGGKYIIPVPKPKII